MPLTSPCIRNCCLDDNNICLGCFRHLDEIMQWSQSNDQLKKQILNNVKTRKEEYKIKYALNLS
ncbi:FIG01056750: hypothetical protein [hydrothermal vent metagenome]|uniref:DUF1289 domain-containing protein n=1 Tax=hydrothermal vent metagenome TaxID=652676 RepID=A0A3B0XJC5_9ZZZZ